MAKTGKIEAAPHAALAASILLAGVTGSCFLRRERWL
jgi:hypothetical protein